MKNELNQSNSNGCFLSLVVLGAIYYFGGIESVLFCLFILAVAAVAHLIFAPLVHAIAGKKEAPTVAKVKESEGWNIPMSEKDRLKNTELDRQAAELRRLREQQEREV